MRFWFILFSVHQFQPLTPPHMQLLPSLQVTFSSLPTQSVASECPPAGCRGPPCLCLFQNPPLYVSCIVQSLSFNLRPPQLPGCSYPGSLLVSASVLHLTLLLIPEIQDLHPAWAASEQHSQAEPLNRKAPQAVWMAETEVRAVYPLREVLQTSGPRHPHLGSPVLLQHCVRVLLPSRQNLGFRPM